MKSLLSFSLLTFIFLVTFFYEKKTKKETTLSKGLLCSLPRFSKNILKGQWYKNFTLKNVSTLNEQSYSVISLAYEIPVSCILYPTAASFSFNHKG